MLSPKEAKERLRSKISELEGELQRKDAFLALLEHIIDSSQDLIAAQDPQFRYLAFNSAYQRETKKVFGFQVELGASMLEGLSHLPEDQQKAVALWGRALRGESFTITEKFQGIGAPRYFEGHWHPLYSDGNIVGASHIVRDVTARVEVENALRRSEEEFRAFFKNAGVGAVQLDERGRFVRVNHRFCEMTGYSREELLKMTPFDITDPQYQQRDKKGFQALMRGDVSSYESEKRYLRKDGRPIWVHLAASSIRDLDGTPLRTAAIIQDVSDRKTAAEQLRTLAAIAEEASRAKSEFLASMSHEIRTPMTVFLAALDHLLQIDSNPEHRELLEMAESSAQRLRALIDDILDFSRIEARRVDIQEEPFPVASWLRKIVEMFSLPAGEKNLCLHVDISPAIPSIIIGDQDRLSQILINLLNNAIKFTDEGEVTVTADVHDGDLCISVIDTGVGVPENARHLLFESFRQVTGGRARGSGGTGLGLAICKGLSELMKGRIEMKPRAEGGSVFSLVIPLKAAEGVETASTRSTYEKEADSEQVSARVLLVEDDPQVRKVMERLLAHRGYRTELSCLGKEALDKMRQGTFDLILMDIELPDMAGFEVAERIREMEKGRDRRTPIIGLTAHARTELKEKCIEAGMDDFLTKPVRLPEMWEAMHRHLSSDDHGTRT